MKKLIKVVIEDFSGLAYDDFKRLDDPGSSNDSDVVEGLFYDRWKSYSEDYLSDVSGKRKRLLEDAAFYSYMSTLRFLFEDDGHDQ